ncbi:MAG: glycoside hydrolase family 15 protein [Tepidisphaerales bacterium]
MLLHNEQLRSLMKDRYTVADVRQLWDTLRARGVLDFPSLHNGLFPAAIVSSETTYTGYANVWVRDNIHIAHAHHFVGQTGVAVRTVRSLMSFFQRQRPRFESIIRGQADPDEVMQRPHIRFDGQSLAEIDQKWSHAQNDALGYFLWLYCRLAREGHIQPTPLDQEALGLFSRYFDAIQYWQDSDSGHWEERRKISASSIGTVVAGLRELRRLTDASGQRDLPRGTACSAAGVLTGGVGDMCATPKAASGGTGGTSPATCGGPRNLLDRLITAGESALRQIFPWECRQADPARNRRFDAALLFLIFPLEVVDAAMAHQILTDVAGHLQGDHGIRRYLGDSFWAADYKQKLAPEFRTVDMGDDMAARDALARDGCEAQWCIFDPIVSTIYGRQYQATRDPKLLELQTVFLNRSLGQITGAGEAVPPWKCPELYYLEAGRYVANDATPLLWTQANLLMALKTMSDSAAL